jgi:hypothetical protein
MARNACASMSISSEHDPEKACPGLDPGWVPVSRLREALARLVIWLEASAGEGRSEKIMLHH